MSGTEDTATRLLYIISYAGSDAGRMALVEFVSDVDRLHAENDRLRAALRDHDTCVVCQASLVPYDGPLHCDGCVVTDEHYYAWQDRRAALSESEDPK